MRKAIWFSVVVCCAGCWMRAERQMAERVETMESHLEAWFDGLDAGARGDDAAVRDALARLSKGGELPGRDLAEPLAVLHGRATALKKVDAAERAAGLVGLSADCAMCHTGQGHTTPPRFEAETPLQRAGAALLWHDAALWSRASAELRGQGWAVPEGADWGARRAALGTALASAPAR